MVDVPPLTPLTTPVVATTVATDDVLVLQVPPVDVFANVDVAPWQKVVVPVIDAGIAVTLTVVVAGVPQPVV